MMTTKWNGYIIGIDVANGRDIAALYIFEGEPIKMATMRIEVDGELFVVPFQVAQAFHSMSKRLGECHRWSVPFFLEQHHRRPEAPQIRMLKEGSDEFRTKDPENVIPLASTGDTALDTRIDSETQERPIQEGLKKKGGQNTAPSTIRPQSVNRGQGSEDEHIARMAGDVEFFQELATHHVQLLIRRSRELRSQLIKYGWHSHDCNPSEKCICGWYEAVERAVEEYTAGKIDVSDHDKIEAIKDAYCVFSTLSSEQQIWKKFEPRLIEILWPETNER